MTTPIQRSAFNGTWQAIPETIYFSDSKPPAGFSLSMVITITEDLITYLSTNDTDKSKAPILQAWEASLDGTPMPMDNQARFNQISVMRISANDYRIMKMKDGDVISGEFWTMHPDGSKFVRRGVAKSPEGRSHVYDEWFRRVA
jgi:hypothetical protein